MLVVAVGVVGAGVYALSAHRATQHSASKGNSPSEHGSSIDEELAPYKAMVEAPEGATPCETGWNAITAEQNAAKEAGRDSIFTWVAPHDEFIAKCETLPKEAQQCMAPKFSARNKALCQKLRPPPEQLDAMRKLRPEAIKEGAPGSPTTPGSSPVSMPSSSGS